jgi:uncharacterized protein (TIGR02594 family)
MKLPAEYQWLGLEDGPRHLLKAIELYGTQEIVGSKHNPVIMGWAKETGLQSVYTADEIPWCGLFIAVIMKRADRQPVKDPLWAANWNNFGVKVKIPMLGDVLTFTRQGGGHVGLYIGEDNSAYYVLGGNQGNKVSIVRILKSRLSQVRRPIYNIQPRNVRRILIDTKGGELSTNEA